MDLPMGGLAFLVAVLALCIWLIRYLRKREIEAFMGADLSAFQEFAANREDIQPLPQEAAAIGSAVVDLKATAVPFSQSGSRFSVRDAVFDEVHRDFLRKLETVVGERFRVFVHLPLSDFVRVDSGDTELRSRTLSFLLCEKDSLEIACGILLQGASPSEMEKFRFFEEIFAQIDRPFVAFAMIAGLSEEEVREKLDAAMADSPLSKTCPKCGNEMAMRKAVSGANAGKSFWVCTQFPSCKGILRIGGW